MYIKKNLWFLKKKLGCKKIVYPQTKNENQRKKTVRKKKKVKMNLGENLIICLLLSIKKNNDNIYMNIILFIHSTIPKEIKMKKKQN